MSKKMLSDTYHMLVEQLRFEGKLIWTRHQVFIVLNSAIFAGLSLGNRPGNTGLDMRIVYGASAFGVVLCILWFLTTYRSQVYYRYWIKQVRAVEEKMDSDEPIFADLHRAHRGDEIKIGKEIFSFKPIERFASISRISRLVAIAFTVIWIVLAIAFSF